jgi:DNA topoisomerase-1
MVKKAKRGGKVFYGCSDYPECDFVSWNKPIAEQCPKCGAAFLLEKTTKRDGTVHYCQNEECDHSVSVASEADVVAAEQATKNTRQHKST